MGNKQQVNVEIVFGRVEAFKSSTHSFIISFCRNQPQPLRNTINMSVDGDGWLSSAEEENNVGGFGSYSGKG